MLIPSWTYLEVYDDTKHEDGGKEVHEIGEVLPVEGFPQCTDFVLSRGQQVEEGDYCSLKFST